MNNDMHKTFLISSMLALLLVVLPTLLFFVQQRQEQRSRATASTTLALTPSTSSTAPLQKNVGDPVSFDVMVNPGNNLPSTIKLQIQYDPTKLQPASVPFATNIASFPTIVEGPVVSNGSVFISVSIGADPTKAVQTITKVGTVNFTTIAPTDTAATTVSFGNKTLILSLAASDQSTENVLSTTVPGYVSIAALPTQAVSEIPTTNLPSTAPTTNLTPSEMLSLSPTVFAPSTTEIPTVTPTAAPTNTPTPTPISTRLAFTVFMHGIGNSGDNANPDNSSLSNKNPLHPNRSVTVTVYNTSNQLVATQMGTINYSSVSGSFTGTVDMGNVLTQRQYAVKIQSPTLLRRLVPGIQTIIPLQTTTMPTVTLIAGDANSDNTLNILDYNLIIGCYSDLLPPVSCTADQKAQADINDDGAVNQVDYNLFLREITVQNGS